MGASMRLRAVVILVVVCVSGCASFSKWNQERHAAQLQRRQNEEAADLNKDSKADAAAKLKRAQHDARLRQAQSELIARGDPDSLAAAALIAGLLSGFEGTTSVDLAARAVAGAPARADLAFVQLQLCESAPGCDALPIETYLQQLDPHNGITWTYQLVRADLANDGPNWKRARDGLAQSTSVDLYWNHIVSRLAKAMAGKAGFDATSAAIQLLGIESSFAPAFDPISRACSVQDIQQPEVLGQCRQIAAAFRNADTSLFEAYGSSLALHLWPDGSAESRQIAEERRALRYRVELMTRNEKKINSPQAQRILAPLISRYPTEQATYHALFVALGLVADPPANWTENGAGS
jgi:hypothetical protein